VTPYQDAPETKPTPAALWERAGYLRAAYDADADVDTAYAAAAAAYDAVEAACAAAAAAAAPAYADAYEAGKARWAREHPKVAA